jgi:tetratricopeptide (TPR) repeat protein
MLAAPVDPATLDTGMLQPKLESSEIQVPDGAELCGRLLRMFGGTFRPEAERCLADLAATAKEPAAKVQVSLQLLRDAASDGDWAQVEETVRSLPEVDRGPALASALNLSQGTEDCAVQSKLALEILSSHDLDQWGVQNLGNFLVRCRISPDARKLLAIRLADGDPREARVLVEKWAPPRGGGWFAGPVGEEAVSILLQRLDREPSSYELWRALDFAYQSNGALEERRQHLRRWIAAESSAGGSPSLRPYLELGELMAEWREDAGVIELLQSAPPPWDEDDRLLELLLGALIREGRAAEAKALGAKVLESDRRESASPRHLLLARAASAVGDNSTALQHYRVVLREKPVSQRMAQEFLGQLLAQMEDQEQAFVRAAEETCPAPTSGSRSPAVQECIGDRLVEFGRPVAALPFYEEALEQAPNNASLRSKIAFANEQSER